MHLQNEKVRKFLNVQVASNNSLIFNTSNQTANCHCHSNKPSLFPVPITHKVVMVFDVIYFSFRDSRGVLDQLRSGLQ